MKKLSFTWSIMRASLEVLKKDKELLIFSVISAVCIVFVSVSFIIPLYISGNWQPPEGDASLQEQVSYYLVLFIFYFCNYFIIIFFNSAIVACAKIRMEGGDPTVSNGFQAALARLPLIAGWALIAASVGLILRIIEDRLEKFGRIVAGLLGMAWSVVSFLVIPILVIEKRHPIAAFKESSLLLKKTWGEQLIGNFSFGLIFFLLTIPAFIIVFLVLQSGISTLAILLIALSAVYFLLLALVQSTLQAIFQAAVYLYARKGEVPRGFEPAQLMNAMTRK